MKINKILNRTLLIFAISFSTIQCFSQEQQYLDQCKGSSSSEVIESEGIFILGRSQYSNIWMIQNMTLGLEAISIKFFNILTSDSTIESYIKPLEDSLRFSQKNNFPIRKLLVTHPMKQITESMSLATISEGIPHMKGSFNLSKMKETLSESSELINPIKVMSSKNSGHRIFFGRRF